MSVRVYLDAKSIVPDDAIVKMAIKKDIDELIMSQKLIKNQLIVKDLEKKIINESVKY